MKKTTLAGRVLAESNIDNATAIAFFGRTLTPIQWAALSYQTNQGTAKAQFLQMINDALKNYDGNSLREVAYVFESLKKTLESAGMQPDMYRVRLLWTKKHLIETKQSIPITVLADMLKIEDVNHDGFSTLRRDCKKLGVPLAAIRRGRKRIKAGKPKLNKSRP